MFSGFFVSIFLKTSSFKDRSLISYEISDKVNSGWVTVISVPIIPVLLFPPFSSLLSSKWENLGISLVVIPFGDGFILKDFMNNLSKTFIILL